MSKKIHSGNVVLIGFGAMIIFMSVLVYLCTQNPSVMVSKNYYEEELKYQDRIDAKQNTEAYDQQLLMTRGDQEIVLTIPEAINQNLQKASLEVYNLSDDSKDRHVDLAANPAGIYTVNTADWGKGNYRVKLSIEAGGKQYYKEFPY